MSATVWPSCLGGVAIAFGVLGVLGGLCGIVGAVFADAIAGLISKSASAGGTAGPSTEEIFAAMSKYKSLNITQGVVSIAVAALLLFGGIKLLQRRAQCRAILMNWAVLKFAISISGLWIAYLAQAAQAQIMPQIMPQVAVRSVAGAMMFAMLGLWFLWLIALPVFTVTWMNRARIRSEMSQWACQGSK